MRTRPFVLPEDDLVLLRDRLKEGLTAQQIADKYGVTSEAVYVRFKQMGRPWRDPRRTTADVVPWTMHRLHLSLDGYNRLRYHVKERLGEELKPAAQKRLTDWHTRLCRDSVVLNYVPDGPSPWVYVPRLDTDDDLVIRWPAGQQPTSEQRKLLRMPECKN